MKILFVCTGNTCRSPMAEGYFRHICAVSGRTDMEVKSAGTFAAGGLGPSPYSERVMSRRGVDISGHRTRGLDKGLVDWADLVVVMGDSHTHTVLSLSPGSSGKTRKLLEFSGKQGDVFDPYGGAEALYEICFSEMKCALDDLLKELINKGKGAGHEDC